jgi:cysteine-rich repeat protein
LNQKLELFLHFCLSCVVMDHLRLERGWSSSRHHHRVHLLVLLLTIGVLHGNSQTATCPNGVLDPGETCDDGNNIAQDGCYFCQNDPGFVCVGTPSVCDCAPDYYHFGVVCKRMAPAIHWKSGAFLKARRRHALHPHPPLACVFFQSVFVTLLALVREHVGMMQVVPVI